MITAATDGSLAIGHSFRNPECSISLQLHRLSSLSPLVYCDLCGGSSPRVQLYGFPPMSAMNGLLWPWAVHFKPQHGVVHLCLKAKKKKQKKKEKKHGSPSKRHPSVPKWYQRQVPMGYGFTRTLVNDSYYIFSECHSISHYLRYFVLAKLEWHHHAQDSIY